jgi:hypothetical protein
MAWQHFLWFDENIEHVAEHDLSPADVEHAMNHPDDYAVSHSSGLPCLFGYTSDGRYILVVYEEIDDRTVYPVTAYEVPEPKRGRL